jgi:hypothetical protein
MMEQPLSITPQPMTDQQLSITPQPMMDQQLSYTKSQNIEQELSYMPQPIIEQQLSYTKPQIIDNNYINKMLINNNCNKDNYNNSILETTDCIFSKKKINNYKCNFSPII